MPTITVDRVEFFKRLGREYTAKEFDELLFQYGLELDEDTTTDANHPADEPHQLKIEIPANRYDLLCIEGIVRALKLWLDPSIGAPKYRLSQIKEEDIQVVHVQPETAKIRPYFASAILRNVKFNKLSYDSFIDLQDKLHSNLARRRTLVSIGTHDLSRIAPGPISYEALPPPQIKFVPLNKTEELTAPEMMALYKEEKHLSKFLHIIEDSEVYPILYDSTRQVLSMPPIINSDYTKITLDTTDVFIDITATDETKLAIVADMMVTMFAEYCAEPFVIEPVKIIYPDKTVISPPLTFRPFEARVSYINSCTGLDLSRDQVIKLLTQMGHEAFVPNPSLNFVPLNARSDGPFPISEDVVHMYLPPTRPDIMHECDVMEDAAIAYGFDNLKKTFPRTNTVAKPFPINKLSDVVRRLAAEAGWLEVLPLTLCSRDENYKFLNRPDDNLAVVLANPKTIEYQVIRTSLIPGILKTIRENRKHSLPIRVFEVGDIVIKDDTQERMSRNIRKVCGVFCGRKAGFEIVHGLLDRIMLGLGIKLLGKDSSVKSGYYIKGNDDDMFFPGRGADVYYRAPADALNLDSLGSALGLNKDVKIGSLGILHPSVLKAFGLDYPCSVMEFDIEPFL